MEMYFLLSFAQNFLENQHFLSPGTHTYTVWIFPASNPLQEYNDLVGMGTLNL